MFTEKKIVTIFNNLFSKSKNTFINFFGYAIDPHTPQETTRSLISNFKNCTCCGSVGFDVFYSEHTYFIMYMYRYIY